MRMLGAGRIFDAKGFARFAIVVFLALFVVSFAGAEAWAAAAPGTPRTPTPTGPARPPISCPTASACKDPNQPPDYTDPADTRSPYNKPPVPAGDPATRNPPNAEDPPDSNSNTKKPPLPDGSGRNSKNSADRAVSAAEYCPPGCDAAYCEEIMRANQNAYTRVVTLLPVGPPPQDFNLAACITKIATAFNILSGLSNLSFDVIAAALVTAIKMAIRQLINALLTALCNMVVNTVSAVIKTVLNLICIPLPNLFQSFNLFGLGATSCNGLSLETLATGTSMLSNWRPFGASFGTTTVYPYTPQRF